MDSPNTPNSVNDYMYGAFTRVYSDGKLFNYGDVLTRVDFLLMVKCI
ncbi:MAG: hypothetical protein R2779_06085 [Crocinitomicaceae bacterium]